MIPPEEPRSFAPEQKGLHFRIERETEKLDEHVSRHRDIPQQEHAKEPPNACANPRFLVSDPRIKSEEAKVAVKQRRDEPRMSEHLPRRPPKRHLQTRPPRDGKHANQNNNKRSAQEKDHDSGKQYAHAGKKETLGAKAGADAKSPQQSLS